MSGPRRPWLLAGALAAAGCATPRAASGPDPLIVAGAMRQAAAQVKTCYRAPRLPRAARGIATRLRVRFGSDGGLIELPTVVAQSGVTPDNQRFAGGMAIAAIEAVVRCTPLRLPPEQHQGVWADFELIFSPSGRA